MISHTDPGNPLLQERLNGLMAFYQSNGYDANDAYDAAVNGITGMVKLQSFFLGMSELLLVGAVVAIALALVVFILWIVRNYRMLFEFISFKQPQDKNLQTRAGNN